MSLWDEGLKLAFSVPNIIWTIRYVIGLIKRVENVTSNGLSIRISDSEKNVELDILNIECTGKNLTKIK